MYIPNMHPTSSFMKELSLIEWVLGITKKVPSKSEIEGWLKDARIEIERLGKLHEADDAKLVEVGKISTQAISKSDISNTQDFNHHIFCCKIIKATGVDPVLG
ncbi:hypothetical protein MKX01_018214 [Papaver californicum]|nr:hypothetical protein MKX01_018214 [Papaver californicum]